MVGVGDRAPDFALTDQHGKRWTLASFAGRQHVVLFFYPKDDTPTCTQEACLFRDQHAAFIDLGAAVLGVSGDDLASHAAFAEKFAFPYPLLADPGRKVAKAYGALAAFGLWPQRFTFVIDKGGVIRHVTRANFAAHPHVEEARRALEALG